MYRVFLKGRYNALPQLAGVKIKRFSHIFALIQKLIILELQGGKVKI